MESVYVDGVRHQDMYDFYLSTAGSREGLLPSQVVALDAPIEIRQAAAVNFKNYVKFNWVSNGLHCKHWCMHMLHPQCHHVRQYDLVTSLLRRYQATLTSSQYQMERRYGLAREHAPQLVWLSNAGACSHFPHASQRIAPRSGGGGGCNDKALT